MLSKREISQEMQVISPVDQKKLNLFRTFSFLGGFLILALGLLNRLLIPTFVDPLPERVFIGLAFLVFATLTFFSTQVRKQALFWFYGLIYLASLWYLHLTYLNHLSFITVFGLVMIIFGCSAGFQSTRALAVYVVSMIVGASFSASLATVPEVTPSFFVRTVVIIGVIVLFVLRARLEAQAALITRNELLSNEVSERREIEAMLRESEARYRHLVDHAHDVIYRVDSQGRFTYINPEALRIFGYTEEEAIGKHFTEAIREDRRRRSLVFYVRQLQERISSTYLEFPAVIRDGSTFWLGQNVQLILDGDQVLGFEAVARDITERKRAEAQIQELSKDLHQRAIALETANEELEATNVQLAQLSEYKSEFLANMSHELRTPLVGMLLLSDILADNKEKTLTDEQVNFANLISSGGRNLASIIDDILDLSKVEAGKITLQPENVSLLSLIENNKRQFEPVAEKKSIEFRFEKKGRIPQYITTDVLRVEQILRNLLSIAFKFTESGSVTIVVGEPGAGVEFSQTSLSRQRTVALSVMDTGIGIPEKKQQLIFEAFRQVDGSTTRKYGGTGLGLSISARLAQLLGGELQVESEEGKGSTFTLYLPYEIETATSDDMVRVEALDSATQPRSSSDGELSLKPAPTDPSAEFIPDDRAAAERASKIRDENLNGIKILLADDDSRITFGLSMTLKQKGAEVVVAENGVVAIEALASEDDFDLVLMDIMMPVMDGYEAMREIRRLDRWADVPIIVVTAKAMAEDRQKCIDAGATDYISKPIDVDKLLLLIRTCLQK